MSALNAPASNFKELAPGTQYWTKLSSAKVPKNYPDQCNYNSYELKDDISNFAKTHCLIGDHIAGKLVNFVNEAVTTVAVDSVLSSNIESSRHRDVSEHINIFYLGTPGGKIIKMSTLNANSVISEWTLKNNDPINELIVNPGQFIYAATSSSMQQISLDQCSSYKICTTCMRDPYCGWNIRQNTCDSVKANVNVVALNENLCSRFQRQDNVRAVVAESKSSVRLSCEINEPYLYEFVEWKKNEKEIGFSENIFLSDAKGKLILILIYTLLYTFRFVSLS